MSIEDDFNISAKLGVQAPCYLRKVDRRSDCGDKDDPPESRVAVIKDNVLSADDGVLSFFYVTNTNDLIRTAFAINWHRTGGTRIEGLCLLAFAPDEIEGVSKKQTIDSFACHWARRHHWNVKLEPKDRERISRLIAERKRFPNNFTKPKLQAAAVRLQADGCLSIKLDSTACKCERFLQKAESRWLALLTRLRRFCRA